MQVDLKDAGSILGLGGSPAGGRDNSFQYSCLENPMDTGAWWATVYRVTQSDTTEATKHACSIVKHRNRNLYGFQFST